MQKFLHPQSIVQITTIAVPATARPTIRCPKFAHSQRLPPRGSCHEVTEGVSRPQAIVQNPRHHPSASLPPSSGRRANRKPACDDVVGGHRCTESSCHSAKTTSPATMPWVGIVAQKAPAFQNSRKESNKTPTATPKPIPAQGAKRVEQK